MTPDYCDCCEDPAVGRHKTTRYDRTLQLELNPDGTPHSCRRADPDCECGGTGIANRAACPKGCPVCPACDGRDNAMHPASCPASGSWREPAVPKGNESVCTAHHCYAPECFEKLGCTPPTNVNYDQPKAPKTFSVQLTDAERERVWQCMCVALLVLSEDITRSKGIEALAAKFLKVEDGGQARPDEGQPTKTKPRWFPVMWPYDRRKQDVLDRQNCPRAVQWSFVAPHEAQAVKNHGQSLERLAERGGLSPSELVAVLENRPWMRMADAVAAEALFGHVKLAERNAAAAVVLPREQTCPCHGVGPGQSCAACRKVQPRECDHKGVGRYLKADTLQEMCGRCGEAVTVESTF